MLWVYFKSRETHGGNEDSQFQTYFDFSRQSSHSNHSSTVVWKWYTRDVFVHRARHNCVLSRPPPIVFHDMAWKSIATNLNSWLEGLREQSCLGRTMSQSELRPKPLDAQFSALIPRSPSLLTKQCLLTHICPLLSASYKSSWFTTPPLNKDKEICK